MRICQDGNANLSKNFETTINVHSHKEKNVFIAIFL